MTIRAVLDLDAVRRNVLVGTLQLAVQTWIMCLRDCTPEHRRSLMREVGHHHHKNAAQGECTSLAQIVAAHSDDLQFGGSHCRDGFNALAKAIAIAAFEDGGVTAVGLHWCVGSGHMGTGHTYPCADEVARQDRERARQPEAAEKATPERTVVTIVPRGEFL